MKKIPRFVILLVVISIVASCKKGPDDPKISLRTRKARLAGKWRMVKGNGGITQDQPGYAPFAQGFTFDGSSTLASQTSNNGPQQVYNFAYILSLTIDKDGSFTLSENYGGTLLLAKGTWDFLKGVGKETKNKEEVIFRIETVTNDETLGHLFNQQGSTFTYKLLELKNKEMRMESGSSEYLNSAGGHFSYSLTYDFVQ